MFFTGAGISAESGACGVPRTARSKTLPPVPTRPDITWFDVEDTEMSALFDERWRGPAATLIPERFR